MEGPGGDAHQALLPLLKSLQGAAKGGDEVVDKRPRSPGFRPNVVEAVVRALINLKVHRHARFLQGVRVGFASS